MYPNLNAEMARRGINIYTLSEKTGIRYNTLAAKLRGDTDLKMTEAIKIKDAIDPAMNMDYLYCHK